MRTSGHICINGKYRPYSSVLCSAMPHGNAESDLVTLAKVRALMLRAVEAALERHLKDVSAVTSTAECKAIVDQVLNEAKE